MKIECDFDKMTDNYYIVFCRDSDIEINVKAARHTIKSGRKKTILYHVVAYIEKHIKIHASLRNQDISVYQRIIRVVKSYNPELAFKKIASYHKKREISKLKNELLARLI